MGKYALLGLAAILLVFFLMRAREVGIGAAAGEVGNSLGNIGTGVSQLGSGIGTGLSGLFNPAYTVLDLANRARMLIAPSPTAPAATNTRVLGGQPAQPASGGAKMVDSSGDTMTVAPVPTQADINAAILKAHPRGTLSGPAFAVGTFFSAPNVLTELGTETRQTVRNLLQDQYFRNAPNRATAITIANYYTTGIPEGVITAEQRRNIATQLAAAGRR